MAIVAYSNQYTLNPDARTYTPNLSPNNLRRGDSVWVNATVVIPAGSLIGDTAIIAPVVAGIRPVRAWFTNPQANAALTCDVGYTSAGTAISAVNAFANTATTVSLTDAQLSAITVLPVSGDNLVLTLRGATVVTVATWRLYLEFVNTGI
jgi:hypothetical protein